jgi:hypothetical protein
VLTFILTFLVLQETNPRIQEHPDMGLSILQLLKRPFTRGDSTQHTTYAPLAEDSAGLESQEDAREEHAMEEFTREQEDGARTSSVSEALEADGTVKPVSDRAFTSQVMLQILAVSLLAFHKVASDSLMGTFLALPESAVGVKPAEEAASRSISFPHPRGGFGFDQRVIGIVFLTEAIFRAAIQPTAIPWFISKLGELRAFRWVLGLYPAMYILTPFLPRIPSPLRFILLFLDLWIKVAFSSVGYICSAVL